MTKKKEKKESGHAGMRVTMTISMDVDLAIQLADVSKERGVTKISLIEEGLESVLN